jgi:cytochrome c
MDSFTLNKIAGAVLMVILLTMGVGIMSDIIFTPTIPGKPGYEIVLPAEGEATTQTASASEVEPIGVRLASADAAKGEKVARKCMSCHTFEQGGANKTGPALWNVVGRKPGSADGAKYSSGMAAYGAEHDAWTFETLDEFLTSPKNVVTKTSMAFAGLRKPTDRADLIAYLREQADSPVPLPAE